MRRVIAITTAAICLALVAGCSTTSHEEVVGATTSSTERQRGSDTGDRDRSTIPDHDDEDTDHTSPFDDLEDCAEAAREYFALTLAPAALSFASPDEVSDFEDDVRDLQEKVPRELRDDFETVSQAYQRFAEALRSVVGDPLDPDNAQVISEAQDALDAPDVQAASERIQDYFRERCPG